MKSSASMEMFFFVFLIFFFFFFLALLIKHTWAKLWIEVLELRITLYVMYFSFDVLPLSKNSYCTVVFSIDLWRKNYWMIFSLIFAAIYNILHRFLNFVTPVKISDLIKWPSISLFLIIKSVFYFAKCCYNIVNGL